MGDRFDKSVEETCEFALIPANLASQAAL